MYERTRTSLATCPRASSQSSVYSAVTRIEAERAVSGILRDVRSEAVPVVVMESHRIVRYMMRVLKRDSDEHRYRGGEWRYRGRDRSGVYFAIRGMRREGAHGCGR